MSRSPNDSAFSDVGFPRVSGDEPAARGTREAGSGFSPRERG